MTALTKLLGLFNFVVFLTEDEAYSCVLHASTSQLKAAVTATVLQLTLIPDALVYNGDCCTVIAALPRLIHTAHRVTIKTGSPW